MSNTKFILFAIFTSAIWGGMLIFSFFDFKNSEYSFLIFLALQYFIVFGDSLFMDKKEKETLRKKYNEPLTRLFFLSLVTIFGVLAITIYLYIKFSNNIENYLPADILKDLTYVGIGAIWTFSIQKAWYKKQKA